MRSLTKATVASAAAVMGFACLPAHASLTTFTSFTGTDAASTSGCGSTAQSCTLTANVPVGSTVLAAYLYSSMFGDTVSAPGGTLGGQSVTYTDPLGVNIGFLQAWRADVTSIVAPTINGGAGGAYNFNVTESLGSQDGEALVVVYSNPTLATQSVGILDGFSASSGDTSSINFSQALHPAAPGFHAYMAIGDGFSFDGDCSGPTGAQVSTISVNSTVITTQAGCNDSSQDASQGNGNLITVGNINGPYSPFLPQLNQDHEAYDITPQINDGDQTVTVNTLNPSNDDNIFLEVFEITGIAGFNAPPPDTGPSVPEPGTLALLGTGLLGLGMMRRRRRA